MARCCGPTSPIHFAEAHYKAKFVAAFRKPVLRCVGTNHGAPCPQAFEVDLTTPRTFVDLELLHLDSVRAIASLPHGPGTTVWMVACSAISCTSPAIF